MIRLLLLLIVFAAFASLGNASDPVCLARAALALTGPTEPDFRARAALVLSGGECGHCVPEDVGREKALSARSPLVLFVGGCDGVGKGLLDSGAVLARSEGYTRDGRPATESRAVVLLPDGADFRVAAVIPAPVTAAKVAEVIRPVPPPSPMPGPGVRWVMPSAPSCVNGQCPK